MRSSVLRATAVMVLLVVFACSGYAISFNEIHNSDLPTAAAQPNALPRMIAGPYLLKMTDNSVTLMWQTDTLSCGRIVIRGDGKTAEFRTITPSRLGEIVIKNLRPDTRYNYRLWVNNSRGMTGGEATASFETFPNKPERISFAIYGDTRSNPDRHRQVIDAIAREKNIRFVVHTGDLVGDGRKIDLWPVGFFAPTARLISSVPFFPVWGNHDFDTFFPQMFDLPKNRMWYSFNVADIHIIVLDSSKNFGIGSEQYNWLISDLKKNKAAKWKFVILHAPVYTSGPHGAEDANGEIKEVSVRTAHKLLPELVKEYGITAVFSGHDHFYERSTRDGVNYIVTGGGGAENYSAVNVKLNPYRKVFYSGLHYCIITIDGNHAHIVAKTPEGKVLDQIDL